MNLFNDKYFNSKTSMFVKRSLMWIVNDATWNRKWKKIILIVIVTDTKFLVTRFFAHHTTLWFKKICYVKQKLKGLQMKNVITKKMKFIYKNFLCQSTILLTWHPPPLVSVRAFLVTDKDYSILLIEVVK